jgi:nicotinamidase-related amidase
MARIEVDKKSTALLIADYYEVMGNMPHAVDRTCLQKTLALRQAARKAGLLICYSATIFRPGYPEIGMRNKIFIQTKRSGKYAVSDPLARLHSAIEPAEGEIVVGKHRVNALFGTDLSIILSAREISTLIVLGFATSGAVLSTIRYAADMDFCLFVVEDCCADTDGAVHDFLCKSIFPLQADVVQSSDLIRALGEIE